MRRVLTLLAFALAIASVPRTASAFGVGIGAYGGTTIPLSQPEVKTGGAYGFRLPITLIPLVSLEPYWGESKLGDGDVNGTPVSGFDFSSVGLNAMLGSLLQAPGIKFYPYVGIASTKFRGGSSAGLADVDKTSYNFGLGGALGMSKVSLHGRAELNVCDTGDKTRKFTTLTIGLAYDVWKKL